MEVQLPVSKAHLSNGCHCHAEIQGGLSRHTCLLQALNCFPSPLFSQATKNRFLLRLKHKATLSGGEGTVTNRCISTAGEREVLAPSPGSDKRNVLPSLLLLPSLAGRPPRKPQARVHAVWHHPWGKASSAEQQGDDRQALLKQQAGRR